MLLFLALTAWVVYCGVEKGIEKYSRYIMPGLLLLIIGIAVFALTLSHTDETGATRTGLEGLAVYLKPDFTGMTVSRFLNVVLDAMSQLFFSLSVSMGIMITYVSYVKDDVDLNKANNQVEIFDIGVAFLAGMMIIPAVYVFLGKEGMASGPSLTFISLPKVFAAMGGVGRIVGIVFFLALGFAALTSCVSVMETLVANCMEIFHKTRKQMCTMVGVYSLVTAVLICLGYNVLYFELPLLPGWAPFSLFAPLSPRAYGAGVSPHTLKPDLSDITLGSRVAADPLGASWTHRTCSTPGTGRSRTALLPLNAPGAHGPPLSPRPLFSARAFRAHRSLNRHIGPAAWVRLAAAAPAGSGIVIHKQRSSCCRLLFHRMRPLPKCPVLFPVF